MEFKREQYLKRLADLRGNGLIKVITGARRSGKSYLMNVLLYRELILSGVKDDHIIRFSFENDEHVDLLDSFYPLEQTRLKVDNVMKVNSHKFRAYVKSLIKDEGNYYLLLDEIQILDGFVGTLNGFLGHPNYDVYVSGSNSELLSSDIETRFKGRKSSVHVYPLTLKEVIEGTGMENSNAYGQYLMKGGIPLVYTLGEEEGYRYLKELCDEIYLKDIIARHKVKDPSVLSDLFSFLASSIGSPVSPLSLEGTFKAQRKAKVTDDTIDDYVSYFVDSFLISKAKRFDLKGKKEIGAPYKVYFEDVGVRNARRLFNEIDEGHLLENIVHNELRYRGYDVLVGSIPLSEKKEAIGKNGKAVYGYKQVEIDFLAIKGSMRVYVQCCSSHLLNEELKERELRGLRAIKDSFPKILLVKDGLPPRRTEEGILILDVLDFLLDPSSCQ